MPETTFERVRRVIISGYEEKVDPETIKPESTLEELGLIEYFFGPTPTFMDLEEDLKKDYPDFEFPDEKVPDDEDFTVQQIVDLIDEEIEILQVISETQQGG